MDRVTVHQKTVRLEAHAQDPDNPHPPFPQWSPHAVYPHSFWGSMRRYRAEQEVTLATLENEFLRVTIAPDIGGRIWDVYDKVGQRHLANFNSGLRSYNAGFGLNYTAGGIECNYPLAHSPTTRCARELSTARYGDGSAAVIISEYERIWRTRWSVAYVLHPGRSLIELRVRVYNRTAVDARYMYWNNCGFVLNEGCEYVFPETHTAMHGLEQQTFSWPQWRHRDLSQWKNTPPEMLGLYFLEATEPFFGYYDHCGDFGLVHYADLADLPGKKHWTWGTQAALLEHYRKTHHADGEVYGEVQSGRIVIQEHLDRLPPESESAWSEIWFPVRGTGSFNGAGPGAALRLEVLGSDAGQSVVQVKVAANGTFPKAALTLEADGMEPVRRTLALRPDQTATASLRLPGTLGPEDTARAVLRAADGAILAEARLKPPNRRDSWLEVSDYAKERGPNSAEELHREAEALARDWGNRDLVPAYQKVLALDPGFSLARGELGKLAIGRGQYAEAVKELRLARERDPDSFDLRYVQGLALTLAGQTAAGRKSLELACRYDVEPRARVRLAELRLREQDWAHALVHLDRLATAWPRLTRPRGLRAACLRHLGRHAEAWTEIMAALEIDGQDPFLRLEAMFCAARKTTGAAPRSRSGKALLAQVRQQEPPLLEAAFDYLAVGLLPEAEAAVGLVPTPGPLALLALAYLRHGQGRPDEALDALQQACRLDVTGHHPWPLEFLDILGWAAQALPEHPRPLFLLGNLLVAHRRLDEGVALWRKAERLGETHSLLFANLGFYESRVNHAAEAAAAWFRRALDADPADLYVTHELFVALSGSGKKPDAVAFLERERAAVRASPRLCHDLLKAYLDARRYADFDGLCAEVDFPLNYQIPGPHQLWWPRQIQEALDRAGRGDLQGAVVILEHPRPVPGALGVVVSDLFEDDRRYYHLGWLYERLGDAAKAREYYERTVALPHHTGYESGYWYSQWSQRYFQALALQKLGRASLANAMFDALELLAGHPRLPVAARQAVMKLVERGRFAPDAEKDPIFMPEVEVRTSAEA
jgi:tetratricopeptide (TPR) repeat protein